MPPVVWGKPLVAWACTLLICDAIVCMFIINRIAYTEIDWKAYMEQVQQFIGGERDYMSIRGGTGPLVYPAGFLYIFAWLRQVTYDGTDIRAAQTIFAAIYLATQGLLFIILGNASLKNGHHSRQRIAIMFVLMCLSRRLHSLYVLRLFNDCVAMLLFHFSLFFFVNSNRYSLGCILYSLAVSVKMNILLFAPGLLVVLLHRFPGLKTVPYLAICASVQILLGLPFLLAHPLSYLKKAFELDREFFYIWTVNFRFLNESTFVSKYLAFGLLGMHLICLYLFARQNWMNKTGFMSLLTAKHRIHLDPSHILDILFVSNFIGITFSRTIHYQFYTWYGHHLAWLLLRTQLPLYVQITLWTTIELVYNVYPPRASASIVLQLAHIVLLLALYTLPDKSRRVITDADKSKPN
uniref:dolichyl-P-Man:Man5GlcNAc2-PP-dolichol alpha-1,3-mannosyltransferase n=1 Tax=Spongospora subterranea TaxID=70186 RepID=A0A0H5RQV3_9EUKA|eukprot:CRZ11099.1 hypothetical protein [Spongospora subterranea]